MTPNRYHWTGYCAVTAIVIAGCGRDGLAPDPMAGACAAIECQPGSTCLDLAGGPHCVPIDNADGAVAPSDADVPRTDASDAPSDKGGQDTPGDARGGAGCQGGRCVVSFASNDEWSTFTEDPAANPKARSLGAARPVCLNASSPPNCPAAAYRYGYSGTGWGLSLSRLPGAYWIWEPGILPGGSVDLKRLFFSRKFTLGDAPGGSISITSDDAAEVRVNGTLLGTVGSVTDVAIAARSQAILTTFDLSRLLVAGENTITIAAQNGPPDFAGCPGSCSYATNPAGVVFGGVLSYR